MNKYIDKQSCVVGCIKTQHVRRLFQTVVIKGIQRHQQMKKNNLSDLLQDVSLLCIFK